MPTIAQLASDTLGHEVASQLNFLDYFSVDEFLQHYQKIYDKNEKNHQALKLLRCAAISRYKPLVKSGHYLCQRALKHVATLRTGSPSTDKLLHGGIYTNEVVELYGRSGKGKTQFALYTCAVSAWRNACNVLYIDTTNCFSLERLGVIISRAGCPVNEKEKVLKRISISQCYDISCLHDIIHQIIQNKKSKEDSWHSQLKLLVVDSIFSILSPVIGYRSPEGYSAANTLSIELRRLAREHFVGVLLINGTVGAETADGLPKAALGVQWQQTADKRLLITEFNEQRSSNRFTMSLVKP